GIALDARGCLITEEWTQLDGIRSLDILFMLDDSDSMHDNRRTVAHFLHRFFELLDASGIHFSTGIMLGHADRYKAGLFISSDGSEIHKVMCRTDWSVEEIATQMQLNMLSVGLSGTAGEAGLYSLKESITTNLEINQNLDFYHEESALAIVFMSDENDISESRDPGSCESGPYHFQPVGMSSIGNNCVEAEIRQTYYSYPDGFLRWGYHQVFSEVLHLKDDLPLFSAAITYQPGDRHSGFEDYGYGYNEFVDMAKRGHKINLDLVRNQPEKFAESFLAFVELLASEKYRLTRFVMKREIIPSSVIVWVDNYLLPDKAFRLDQNVVTIDPGQAGSSGDAIRISYAPVGGCKTLQGLEEEILQQETNGSVRVSLDN
ncbi:MAG: hypothetical protein OEQ53_13550, partial [Saprospiraceae bacterium]|nr:hypothetical protein [Saprospiraceae bacterium]